MIGVITGYWERVGGWIRVSNLMWGVVGVLSAKTKSGGGVLGVDPVGVNMDTSSGGGCTCGLNLAIEWALSAVGTCWGAVMSG
jgi:hypothetical protein